MLGGLVAAGILANQEVERDQEYLRLIAEGDEALKSGQTFLAIEAYSGAIALKRGSMLAYLKRGEAHQRRGDGPDTLSAALRDLRTAAELAPSDTRTLEELGDVNFQLKRFANAAAEYEAYIRIDDQSPAVFYKLALASRGDGRLTRAISALQQAVDAEAHLSRGALRAGAVPERSRAALRGARRVRADDRDRPGVHSGARRAGGAPSAAGAHPRRNRSARRVICARPGEGRAVDCGWARLPARRQSRSRGHRARQGS